METSREKRNRIYREAIKEMNMNNISLGAAMSKIKHGYIKPWRDPNSPTGMSQVCDYIGNCQFPCNGDC
jgi:hypothetical protein